MALVTSKEMLLNAQKGHYAVGAFNVENMEMVMAVIAAAEELNAPVMLQTTPSTVKYAGLSMYLANCKAAADVENMEMVMAVIAAAEELNAPVMLQTTPSTVKYAGLSMYLANCKAAAEQASVPVAMHLDHGDSFALAMQALRTGYTSIMIDGSHNVLEENIALTKRVVDACAPSGIPVEAGSWR